MVHSLSKLMCLICLSSSAFAQERGSVDSAADVEESRVNTRRYFENSQTLKSVVDFGRKLNPFESAPVKSPKDLACDQALGGLVISSELQALRVYVNELKVIFGEDWLKEKPWFQAANWYAMPALEQESSNLFITFFGPSNTFKSTYANLTLAKLAGKTRADFKTLPAPVGFSGGFTKRPLVFVPGALAPGENISNTRKLNEADINARMSDPEMTKSAGELTEQGAPLLVPVDGLPQSGNLVIMDTADSFSGTAAEGATLVKEAERAIVAADVLVITLDMQNYKRPDTRRELKRIFDAFGVRHCVYIWSGFEPLEVVREHVRQFAADVHRQNSLDMHESTLAIYRSKPDEQVFNMEKFPELEPLPGYPEYGDMLAMLSATAESKKAWTRRQVLSSIEASITDVVKDELRKRYVSRIHLLALDRIIESIARRAQSGFPKMNSRASVRDSFFMATHGPFFQGLYDKTGWIRKPIRYMNEKFYEKTRREMGESEFVNRKELIQSLMHKMVAQLRTSNITIDADLVRTQDGREFGGGELELLANNYRGLFDPAFDPRVHRYAPAGLTEQVDISLPSAQNLPEQVRGTFERAIAQRPEELSEHLLEKLKLLDASTDSSLKSKLSEVAKTSSEAGIKDFDVSTIQEQIARANKELNVIFSESIKKKHVKVAKRWNTVSFWTFWGAFVPFLGGISQPAAAMWLVGMGGSFAAKQTYLKRRELELKTLLDEYYNKRQYEETLTYLNQAFAPLRAALDPTFDQKSAALDKVKLALRYTAQDLSFPSDVTIRFEKVTKEGVVKKTFKTKIYAPIAWVTQKAWSLRKR